MPKKRLGNIKSKTKPRDASEGIRSKCPACEEFVTEGTEHRCIAGRNRKNFQNPWAETFLGKY